MSTPKAKRIKFSDEEKFLILEEFALRKDILIPKSGRYKNTPDRQRAWEEIAAAVNSLNPLVQRTPGEICRKWKNMVLDARKELAMEKHPLLRGQPRARLFRNIFALLKTSDATLPEPSLSGSRVRAEPSGGAVLPAGKTGVLSGAPCILYLSKDSCNSQPCQCETPPDSEASALALSEVSLPKLTPTTILPTLQAGEGAGRDGEGARDREEKVSVEPCKPASPDCLRANEACSAQIRRTPSPQSQEPVGDGGCRISGSRNCLSDLTLTCKIECPFSPVLEWPYLGAACSPLAQSSSGNSSLRSEGLRSMTDDSVAEDSQPGKKGCPAPAEEPPNELLGKQSRLQTEVLELQKEMLQLQKEKILLEKEKLLLEILKLRRELGT